MLDDASLYIKWEDVAGSNFAKDDDRANFVVYNDTKEKFVVFTDTTERSKGEVLLELPPDFKNDTLHCYIHYVSTSGLAVSTSVYLVASI